MKLPVNIARVIVGTLFIFSGLVKAIDPLGLAYKMQEFFEVWGNEGYSSSMMNWMHGHAVAFAILMILLEVALGVALLIGWQKKLVSWLLLLLMLFFTFLTSYVLFSGKITACGCFGDCIPITPQQTFTKDLTLLALVILILLQKKYIRPLFNSTILVTIMLVTVMGTTLLQSNAMEYLPVIDCLPYKKGNDLLKLREMPVNAIPDKFDYVFIYEKNGARKEFTSNNLPDNSWKFVDRKQVLVQKGSNNVPPINDFSLKLDNAVYTYSKNGRIANFTEGVVPDSSWTFVEKKTESTDSTEAVLGQKGEYYLFFLQNLNGGTTQWAHNFENLYQKSITGNRRIYIVTSEKEAADKFFNKTHQYRLPVFTCDMTAIKTAARTTPTLYLMRGPVVLNKWGTAALDEAARN